MSQPKSVPPQAAEVGLRVDNAYLAATPVDRLIEVVSATLRREGMEGVELAVVVTGEETLQQLNCAYRGIDTPTDVLSFPAWDTLAEEESVFVSAPDAATYLGDVIISFPAAARQADAAGHSVADELSLLAVHGVLHLLGYDHGTPEEKAGMWAVQDEILKRSGKSA
ncbi:MAG: rRNA maturation RNase YbeY [Chloroflexota bacterium]|nr:rRNA maturation RNase YbeY [Chloroflexota bacterium]